MTSCDISDAAAWQKLGCYLVITPETLQIHFSSLCGTRLFVVFNGESFCYYMSGETLHFPHTQI